MSIQIGHVLIFVGALSSGLGGVLLWLQSNAALIKAKEEIIEKDEYILSHVTGGNGFCYLDIGSISGDGNSGTWVVNNGGDYTVYDVQVDIINLATITQITPDSTLQQMLSMRDIVELGNIPPHTARMLIDPIDLSNQEELKFNIFVVARNGFTVQHLRMIRIENKWFHATRVLKRKGDSDITLFEEVDDNYPKDENGNVNWD
ncbi:MAG: hypothetical protein WBB67_13835 [bacterium]